MRGKALTATLAALAVTGCGATKYVTETQTQTATATQIQTQTQTQTTTIVRHTSAPITNTVTVTNTVTAAAATSAGSGYGSTYPAAFEDSFDTECINSGGDRGICTCALRYIEQHVAYSTVVAAEHDIAIGTYPSWYTDAQTSCAGQ